MNMNKYYPKSEYITFCVSMVPFRKKIKSINFLQTSVAVYKMIYFCTLLWIRRDIFSVMIYALLRWATVWLWGGGKQTQFPCMIASTSVWDDERY